MAADHLALLEPQRVVQRAAGGVGLRRGRQCVFLVARAEQRDADPAGPTCHRRSGCRAPSAARSVQSCPSGPAGGRPAGRAGRQDAQRCERGSEGWRERSDTASQRIATGGASTEDRRKDGEEASLRQVAHKNSLASYSFHQWGKLPPAQLSSTTVARRTHARTHDCARNRASFINRLTRAPRGRALPPKGPLGPAAAARPRSSAGAGRAPPRRRSRGQPHAA
eukprot:SAG22_NODE_318_length_12494_cov_18.507705_3_plen_223_part_00